MKRSTAKRDNVDKHPESKLLVISSLEPKAGEEPLPTQTNDSSAEPKASKEPLPNQTNELSRNRQTQTELRPQPMKAVERNGKLAVHLYSNRLPQQTFGTTDPDLVKRLAAQIERASPKTPLGDATDLNSSLAALHQISPRNAVEGMLAVQMVSTHNHVMDTMRRVSKTDSHDAREAYVNQAVKLARTFALQAAALSNLRINPATNILVEQVNINQGPDATKGMKPNRDQTLTPEGKDDKAC